MAQGQPLAVADASVIAKWFLVEAYRDDAVRLRDDFVSGKLSLSSPALMPFEVINVVKFSSKSTQVSRVKAVGKSLSFYGITLHHLKHEYLDLSAEVSSRNDVTIYDASYIALAEHLQSVLYTADERLLARLTPGDRARSKHISEYRSPSTEAESS